MRKYKCSKEVSAALIVSYEPGFVITSDGARHEIEPRVVEMIHKDAPRNGPGYLVAYKDGYVSYSPRAVFEEGYQLIQDKKVKPNEDA